LQVNLVVSAVLLGALSLVIGFGGSSETAAQGQTQTGGRFGNLLMKRSGEVPDVELRERPDALARSLGFADEPGRSQLRGLRAARERFPFCDLIRSGSSLGILKRTQYGLVPARGAPTRRDELFRVGPADELALGALARTGRLGPDGVTSVPAQDTVRMLYIRIDFLRDRSGNVPVDPTPHNRDFYLSHGEALRRYYEVTTHGRLILEYDIYPQADTAYHTTDMADFGPWDISQDEDIFFKAYDMFRAFAVAADTQDVTIPWGDFDRVTFIHAGSDFQSDVRQDSPNDIPTFTIGVPDSLFVPLADSTFLLKAGMILPETTNQDGFFAA
jgi:hypothetical protein